VNDLDLLCFWNQKKKSITLNKQFWEIVSLF